MTHYPKRCPVCGGHISDIHTTCQWKWEPRGRYETYEQEVVAFSKWYVDEYENRKVEPTW